MLLVGIPALEPISDQSVGIAETVDEFGELWGKARETGGCVARWIRMSSTSWVGKI
jgi:hypothetical protein